MKKQLTDISSGIITTATSLLNFLIVLTILIVLSGGNSFASERQRYKLIVTRPASNVTTILRVYAENEEEARENVALNNWQIISIEPYAEPGAVQMRGAEAGGAFSISITKVGEGDTEPSGKVSVAAGDSLEVRFIPGPCEKIGKLVYNGDEVELKGETHTFENISKDGFIVAVFDQNGTDCADNGILSKNLKEIAVLYFDLGKYKTEAGKEFIDIIEKADREKQYIVIGHTDDVKVIPNEEFGDNFQLSYKRAQFLDEILVEKGFDPANVNLVGLGPAFPAEPNKKEGQPKNRRAILYERTR